MVIMVILQKKEGHMTNTIILYYSYEGSTKEIADHLSHVLSADIEAIQPMEEKKGKKGIAKFFWGGAQVIMGHQPPIASLKHNIDDYDQILLGFPVWAGTYAPPIKSLFTTQSIQGKKIGCFFTHKGGPGKCNQKIQTLIEKNNQFLGYIDFKNPESNRKDIQKQSADWAIKLFSD